MRMSTSSSGDSKPDNYQINARICRLVERYPCMYDRSHPHYLKKDVVDKAWVKIAKEMDDSIPSCKERWRNIRTSFARSINVNKVPSSANRTKPYYLHEELQFLSRHITPGIPVTRRPNYYSSAGEESEMIEVPIGEESFDGFAAMVQDAAEQEAAAANAGGDDDDDDDDDDVAHKAAAMQRIDDATQQSDRAAAANDATCNNNNTAKECEVQSATQQPVTAATQPMEVVTEPDVPIVACTPTLYPLKKRLRTVECMLPEAEPECDVKPASSELNAQDADFDAAFLQGLLPEMKAMDFRQKIVFKKRIYEVISEIFEGATRHTSNGIAPATPLLTNGTSHMNGYTSTPTSSPSTYGFTASLNAFTNNNSNSINTSFSAATNAAMTIVNAADLAMIRRLNALLQCPAVPSSTTAVTALPKNVASISSTVHTTQTPPPTATVAVHRGALTRSSANLLRVTMVNPSMAATSSTSPAQHAVKQEILDD